MAQNMPQNVQRIPINPATQQPVPPQVVATAQQQAQANQQQQSSDADATRFDYLTRSLNLVNSIRDNVNTILDNVAKSTVSPNANTTTRSSSQDDLIDNYERAQFLKDTDVKSLQEKAIDLNLKINELDTLINTLQPIQISNNDFFNILLDQFDDKSTMNASKIMYNYRWLKSAVEDKSSVSINSTIPYKRYQIPYMERKSPKYKQYKSINRPDQFEKSLNNYMNMQQHGVLNTFIKVNVVDITDKEIIIDIQMPQYFKFVLHLYDYIIETVQVKAIDSRTMTSNDGYEDSERKTRLRVFDKLEENAIFASVYYKSTIENQFQAFKQLLNWLKHYANLFTAKCSKCEKHLMGGLPPLWRDLKSYDIYHDECKL